METEEQYWGEGGQNWENSYWNREKETRKRKQKQSHTSFLAKDRKQSVKDKELRRWVWELNGEEGKGTTTHFYSTILISKPNKYNAYLPQSSVQWPRASMILNFSPESRLSWSSNARSFETMWYLDNIAPKVAINIK